MQITQPTYLSLPTDICFDHTFLSEQLRSYRSVKDKISLMLQQGEIIKIRRGLYMRSKEYGGTVNPMNAANLVYGPSYISLESALSYYGLIPEQVEAITCITTKTSKKITTPIGLFLYKHLSEKAYSVGINLIETGGTGILIASKEKALCDRIAQASNIRTIGQIIELLFEDLRIDKESMNDFSINHLNEIRQAYTTKCITLFINWYTKKFKGKDAL